MKITTILVTTRGERLGEVSLAGAPSIGGIVNPVPGGGSYRILTYQLDEADVDYARYLALVEPVSR